MGGKYFTRMQPVRAFAEAGAPVVSVARSGPALAELATTSPNIRTEVADAADATVAWSLRTTMSRWFSSWSPAPTR